jgi:hypothetical protein
MYNPNLDVTILTSKTVRKIVSVVSELHDAIPNTKENYELREKAQFIVSKTYKTNNNKQGLKKYYENKLIGQKNGDQL